MIETASSTGSPSSGASATYTPGQRRRKLLIILYGLFLFIFGLSQIETSLWLTAFGQRTRAEVVAVIKTKEGLPDQTLFSDFDVQKNLEPNDRSYRFWNEFQFHTSDGRLVAVRCPIGSQLKPLYPLTDSDGLPTSDLLFYDSAHPEIVTFPLVISTWFAPGVLMVVGLIAMLIGGTLYYWANTPIVLPHLPPRGSIGTN